MNLRSWTMDELGELNNESCATNEPWGSGKMGEFGKVEPWMYSVKNIEMIFCYSTFQLKAMYIHRMIYHLGKLKNKRIDETTTNNENKPQLVWFSSIFELSQPAPFHSVFKLSPSISISIHCPTFPYHTSRHADPRSVVTTVVSYGTAL